MRLPRWMMIPPPWTPYAIGAAALLALRGLARASGGDALPPPRPPSPAPTIRLGSAGPAVAYWRWVVGLAPSPAKFDQPTHEATRAWQAARGLAADGVVGPATWAAAGITGTTPKPGPVPSPQPQPPKPPPGPKPPPPPPVPPSPTDENVFGLAEEPSPIKGDTPNPHWLAQREAQIMGYVAGGQFEHHWHPITWTKNGRVVRALVSREPLALRQGANRLYVSTTFDTAQAIGDMIGGAMLTTRISDEIHRQAPVKIPPMTRNWYADGTMGKTGRMIEQSAALVSAVASGGSDLKSNMGKDWVLTRRNWPPPAGTGVESPQGASGSRHNGANFGWYMAGASKSPGGEGVIQSIGLMHDRAHADYSQLLRYVKRDSITVDGAPVSYAAALADPALSALLQDEGGTIPSDRHPDL